MRLLVIGHPFIFANNQKKYVAMKRLAPELELRIVGPRKIRNVLHTSACEVHPELQAEEVVPLGAAWSHSHMTYVLNPRGLARVLRSFNPQVIHIEEEPQAFIAQEVLTLRAALCRQAAVTLFTWDNLLRRRRFPLCFAKRMLRRASLRRIATIVCGNSEAERLIREREGYRGLTAVLPQFGLDPAEHIPGRELGLRDQLGLSAGPVVGYAGRLVPEKGIELLVQALADLTSQPWKLLLVGAGPLEKRIHEDWMPRFPGRIVHVPALPHSDVPRYLRCMDIFVLASYATPAWKEQFGLALAQAMLLGIPSAVSSCGAIPEVAGPGALVVAEGSAERLRYALKSLLRSETQRRELGARARARALERYALDVVAARYRAVFEEALRSQAAGCTEPEREAALAASGGALHP